MMSFLKKIRKIAFFIIFLAALGTVCSDRAISIENPTNVMGWAWSGENTKSGTNPVIGWISLNCNDVGGSSDASWCDTSQYGVQIEYSTGNLTGYAWNHEIGWIEFQPEVFPLDLNSDGGKTQSPAYIDNSTRALKGWIREKNANTWIQFDYQGQNQAHVDADNYIIGQAKYNTDTYIQFDNTCNNDRVRITDDDADGIGLVKGCANSKFGQINFSDAMNADPVKVHLESGDFRGTVSVGSNNKITFDPNPFPDIPNHGVKFFRTAQEADWYNRVFDSNTINSDKKYTTGDISGWARIKSIYEEGRKHEYDDWGYVLFHRTSSTNTSIDYGAHIDTTSDTLKFSGFAWSSGGSVPSGGVDKNTGIGWIDFSPSKGEAVFNPPWLETQKGDIYSQGNVGSENTFKAPTGRFNATYKILSNGDIKKFTSEMMPDGIHKNIPKEQVLEYPASSNAYTNILGSLDVNGISSIQDPVYGINVYGTVVEKFEGNTEESVVWPTNKLDGKVYLVNGDLTIDNPMTFLNAQSGFLGGGTVVVEGDLHIDSDVKYDSGSVSNFQQLASIAWIAKGDIIIGKDVGEISGVMVALESKDNKNGGRFITEEANKQLLVRGLVMAHEFYFQRSYGVNKNMTREPSEKIIYDGRLLMNTPPGLENMVQALPILEDVAP